MRQLLIIAIETPDALDIDHLALHVPALIQNAKGAGVLINGDVTPKAVVAAAKEATTKLHAGKQNVSIFPELTRGEFIQIGLRQLAEMMPALGDLDAFMRVNRPKKV